MKNNFSLFLLFGLFPFCALAQTAQPGIYNCNGTYTNVPCPGATPFMQEIIMPTPSPAELEAREREFILDDLKLLSARARNEGLEVSTSGAESTCRAAPLQECITAVEQTENRINALIIEDRKARNIPTPAQVQQNTNVSIAVSNDYRQDWYWQRRYRNWWRRKEGLPPVYDSGTYMPPSGDFMPKGSPGLVNPPQPPRPLEPLPGVHQHSLEPGRGLGQVFPRR